MVEINSYYDDIIDGDNADPAYAAIRDIPIGLTATETNFAPATDPRPLSDLDTYARNELNKLIDRAVLPQYQMITGKTLEENFGKDILGRQLSLAQAFGEAGLPLDPNKESATSAELQDPVIGPLLQKYGYKRQSASEGLERTVETFLRDQRDAREKRQRGEKLTPMEEINASFPMALLDAFDFTGLVALGVKGAFKASRASLKYLLGEAAKGTPKDVALKQFAELYPEDTKALQMSAVQEEKARIGGGSGIPLGADDMGIALAPERNGVGGGPSPVTPKTAGYRVTPQEEITAKLQKTLYGDYQTSFNNYAKQVDNRVSAKGFLDYLKNNNIPLKTESTRPASQLNHIRAAVEYLKKQIPVRVVSGKEKPWMAKAEKIASESDKPLYPLQVAKILNAQGENVDSVSVNSWANNNKIDNIISTSEGKIASQRDLINQEKKSEVKKLVEDLKANPEKQKKGYINYTITLPSTGQKFKMSKLKGQIDASKAGRKKQSFYDDITDDEYNELSQLMLQPKEKIKDKFRNYIPRGRKNEEESFANVYNKVTDEFRGGLFRDFNQFEQVADSYGIRSANTGDIAEDALIRADNKELIEQLNNDIDELRIATKEQRDAYKKVQLESAKLSAYTKRGFRETFLNNPELAEKLFAEMKKFSPKKYKNFAEDLVTAVDEAAKAFAGHVSHIYRMADFAGPNKTFEKGMRGLATISNFVRTNFGVENLALQNMAENVIDLAIKKIKKGLGKGENPIARNISPLDLPMDSDTRIGLDALAEMNELLTRKGMAAYRRLKKEVLTPEVIETINKYIKPNSAGKLIDRPEDKLSDKFSDILLGSKNPQKLEKQKERFDNLMDFYKKNPDQYSVDFRKPTAKEYMIDTFAETPYARKGFTNTTKPRILSETNFNKGGPVRMAIGGDPLQNINQQQFSPDPAFQGQDFFQEAVDSGNLTAFNPLKLFNLFGKVKGTAKKADIGQPTTLPRELDQNLDEVVPVLEESDFPFKSFTYEKLQSPNAPGAAKPQDWANYLTGGDTAPIAEIRDSGLEQYLRDYEKYYPNQKLTKQQIVDYFETSPTGNLEMRVKQNANPSFPDQGRSQHMNAGSQSLDNQGINYREVIVQAGPIPGEGKPFINSTHFSEPNVIAFTRVADYQLADGSTAAVIQELQTDMLNTVRVEQMRIKTLLDRLKLTDRKARDILNNPASTPDQVREAQQTIDKLAQQVSPEQRALLEQTEGIKPFPNAAGASLIPGYTDEILKLQDNVNDLLRQKKEVNQPFIDENIFEINQRQLQLRDQLLDLNRSLELDQNLKGIQVPTADQADELRRLSQKPIENIQYERTNDIELFPPVPFTKTADYVDLIIKATIKDAQARGINKVGIFTGELVNKRWNKDPTGPAGKKFNDLYSKVSVQQMNNIAKKYGGRVIEGAIVDPSKGQKGLKMTGKNVDGDFELLREISPSNREGVDEFLNDEILRIVEDYGLNDVVVRREIAPGQTMEFFATKQDEGLQLTPLGDADRAENATIIIEEFNPSLVKIPVLVLDEAEKAKEPFFLYRKKDGGKIASDGLVSITDIYGDY